MPRQGYYSKSASALAFLTLAIALFWHGAVPIAAAQATDLAARISLLNHELELGRPSRSSDASPVSRLEQTLAARKTLVEELIVSRRSNLRSVALTPAVTLNLTPDQAKLVESDGQWSGVLEQTIGDNFEAGVSTTIWKLNTGTGRIQIVFPSGSHPDHYAGKSITVSGIGTDRVVAVENFSFTVDLASNSGSAQAPVVTSCSTLGDQNIAVLMMNQGPGGASFPSGITKTYLQNQYFSASPRSVPTYWNEVSFNQTNALGTVFGPFTLDANYSCSQTDQIASNAIAKAKAGGVDFSTYSRVSVVFPEASCSFGGLGDIGCRSSDTDISHPYSVTWIPVLPFYNGATELWGTVAHELGHNFGLNHGSSLDFGTQTLGGIDYNEVSGGSGNASSGLLTEYGDLYSIMGSTNCGGHYPSQGKFKTLNWLLPGDVAEVSSTGAYSLVPYEQSFGLRALRVLRDPLTSSWIWMEYRQAIGTYDSILGTCVSGTNVYQGTIGYYESPYSSDGHLFLLDFHPTSSPNIFSNAALLPGENWTDPYSPLRLNVTGANASGLSLNVSYDQPCTTLAVSAPSFASTAGSGSITVTAPQNCSWTATKTASWLTFTGTVTGSGNGSIPFNLAANSSTDQRTGFIAVSRNSVAVSQKGTATYISPMNPVYNSGNSGAITFTFNDPLGNLDIQYARIYFQNSRLCEIDLSQNGSNLFLFVYNADTGSFSQSLGPGLFGQPASITNGHCTVFYAGSSVSRNGNQLQVTMNIAFDTSAVGAHRLAISVCDSTTTPISGCTADIPIGTWEVTVPAAISQVFPASGRQGTTFPLIITGTGTHFTNASAVSISGTGITISGVSAPSPTQINATVIVDANATLGTRTLSVSTSGENVSSNFTVVSAAITISRPSRTPRPALSISPGSITALAVALPKSAAQSRIISCTSPKQLPCAVDTPDVAGVYPILLDLRDTPPGTYRLRLKTADNTGQEQPFDLAVKVSKDKTDPDAKDENEK